MLPNLVLSLLREEEQALSDCAHKIVEALASSTRLFHYTLGDVGPLPFLHFMGPEEQVGEGYVRSRSTTYVHPGVICRSTTGTGTSARLALMNYEGRLNIGDKLETVSLRETGFIGTFTGTHQEGAYQVVENTDYRAQLCAGSVGYRDQL